MIPISFYQKSLTYEYILPKFNYQYSIHMIILKYEKDIYLLCDCLLFDLYDHCLIESDLFWIDPLYDSLMLWIHRYFYGPKLCAINDHQEE